MKVNRLTIRRLVNGEQPPELQMAPDDRMRALDDLDEPEPAVPAGAGLPQPEVRKLEGRASPLSQQARTGRTSLLGDR